MDKNSYIVVAVQENGKYCAYVIKHFNSNNMRFAMLGMKVTR